MQYLILDWILKSKGVNSIKEITDKTWKSKGRLNKKFCINGQLWLCKRISLSLRNTH